MRASAMGQAIEDLVVVAILSFPSALAFLTQSRTL